MTTEEMQKFCSHPDDGGRFHSASPWCAGGFRWATDTIIIIRVPCDEVTPPIEGVRYLPVENIIKWNDLFPLKDAKPLPTSIEIAKVKCEACDGKGFNQKCSECNGEREIECDLGHMHECNYCDGNGYMDAESKSEGSECQDCDGSGEVADDAFRFIEIDGCKYKSSYLEKILSLGEVKYLIADKSKHLMFESGNVQGILANVRA